MGAPSPPPPPRRRRARPWLRLWLWLWAAAGAAAQLDWWRNRPETVTFVSPGETLSVYCDGGQWWQRLPAGASAWETIMAQDGGDAGWPDTVRETTAWGVSVLRITASFGTRGDYACFAGDGRSLLRGRLELWLDVRLDLPPIGFVENASCTVDAALPSDACATLRALDRRGRDVLRLEATRAVTTARGGRRFEFSVPVAQRGDAYECEVRRAGDARYTLKRRVESCSPHEAGRTVLNAQAWGERSPCLTYVWGSETTSRTYTLRCQVASTKERVLRVRWALWSCPAPGENRRAETPWVTSQAATELGWVERVERGALLRMAPHQVHYGLYTCYVDVTSATHVASVRVPHVSRLLRPAHVLCYVWPLPARGGLLYVRRGSDRQEHRSEVLRYGRLRCEWVSNGCVGRALVLNRTDEGETCGGVRYADLSAAEPMCPLPEWVSERLARLPDQASPPPPPRRAGPPEPDDAPSIPSSAAASARRVPTDGAVWRALGAALVVWWLGRVVAEGRAF